MTLPEPVIDAWRFASNEDCSSIVLPDGCRDLIQRISQDGRAEWHISELADAACNVGVRAGERFVGYRFHSAAVISDVGLLQAVRSRPGLDPKDVLSIIHDHVRIDRLLAEALDSLADSRSIGAASSSMRVSERSLERLVMSKTGRTPGYWKGLARARRAARTISGSMPLSEVAMAHGYSDQAHMNREIRKWFGATPGRFREHPELTALVEESGYG